MKPVSFDLQIDELVLRGFESLDTIRLSTALERHLSQLLSAEAPSLQSRQVTLLNAPAIEAEADADELRLAESLANSLYAMLLGNGASTGGAA